MRKLIAILIFMMSVISLSAQSQDRTSDEWFWNNNEECFYQVRGNRVIITLPPNMVFEDLKFASDQYPTVNSSSHIISMRPMRPDEKPTVRDIIWRGVGLEMRIRIKEWRKP